MGNGTESFLCRQLTAVHLQTPNVTNDNTPLKLHDNDK